MPVFTTKIQWRSGTPTRTKNALMGLLKSHFQNANAAWTIIDDQTANATNPYLAITKNRGTGFSGDNIVSLIQFSDAQNRVYFRTFSSWSAASGTGSNGDARGSINSNTRFLDVSFNTDMDFFISTDTNFIVATCKVGSPLTTQNRYLVSLSAFERYAGDSSVDTFFGGWEVAESSSVFTPLLSGSANSFYECQTILGGMTSLSTVNESGNDVLLPFYVSKAGLGKHKGQFYGVRMTTNSASVTEGTITSVVDGSAWMIVKAGSNQSWAMAVGTGASLNTVS